MLVGALLPYIKHLLRWFAHRQQNLGLKPTDQMLHKYDRMQYCIAAAAITDRYEGSTTTNKGSNQVNNILWFQIWIERYEWRQLNTNTKLLLNELLCGGRYNHCQSEGSTNTKEGLNEVLHRGRYNHCKLRISMNTKVLPNEVFYHGRCNRWQLRRQYKYKWLIE